MDTHGCARRPQRLQGCRMDALADCRGRTGAHGYTWTHMDTLAGHKDRHRDAHQMLPQVTVPVLATRTAPGERVHLVGVVLYSYMQAAAPVLAARTAPGERVAIFIRDTHLEYTSARQNSINAHHALLAAIKAKFQQQQVHTRTAEVKYNSTAYAHGNSQSRVAVPVLAARAAPGGCVAVLGSSVSATGSCLIPTWRACARLCVCVCEACVQNISGTDLVLCTSSSRCSSNPRRYTSAPQQHHMHPAQQLQQCKTC
eukprot:scaffold167531_cov21-Tisochrysis_lutea.AAC.2